MDIIFHAVSAGILAEGLGEKRKRAIVFSMIIGINPDVLSNIGLFFWSKSTAYPLFHSLLFQGILCLVLLPINWRAAFGGLLHIAVDVFTHQYSTRHLFYPSWKLEAFDGLNWYQADGIWIWSICWIILAALVWLKHGKRAGMAGPAGLSSGASHGAWNNRHL